MSVLTGGLVLFTERTPLVRREGEPVYGRNSFLGYAFILLGLFMGAGDPHVRSLSVGLAGAVWLAQAAVREDLLHAWIAFTLLVLAGGSIAAWPGFPLARVPALALALALAVHAAGLYARRFWRELPKASAGMQAVLFNAAAVLAVLSQWHYRTAALITASLLLASAAGLAWRARADRNSGCLHAAMLTLALSLPYLGFADVSGRTLHGNNLALGLALLSWGWLALARAAAPARGATAEPLVLEARSAVLVMYGALAVAALALRVAFEQGRPGALAPLAAAASLGGPLLMAAALLRAAYFSRSLLPVGMACALGVVLLPQLEAEIRAWLPFLSWGTGLASAACACSIALACFPIRASAALADLGEGDRLSPDHPFPFQRRDHTLFTWPLLASAVFLAAKVDAWNIYNTPAIGKTAAALLLAGLAWTVMAVYARGWPRARLLVRLGSLSFVGGFYFAWFRFLPDGGWQGAAVLCGSALTALYLFYAYVLAPARPWAQDLLAAPVRGMLKPASILFSAAAIASMFAGGGAGDPALLAFAAAQLIWFGLTDGHPVFGSLLFLQTSVALLAWAAPGDSPLILRLSPQDCATPFALFLLAIVGAQTALEVWPAGEAKLRPLAAPVFSWTAVAAFTAGAAWALDAAGPRMLTDAQRWLTIALLLAAARAQACAPLALIGLLLAYVQLAGDRLFAPLYLGACALALAALAEGGKRLHVRRPGALASPSAQDYFRVPALPWSRSAACHGPTPPSFLRAPSS
ncbi:MAG: hypothetical protein NTX64_13995 [Elusimicrobia bacterium]|nr:hypothetical protein [Elusimicrobiota bacterium]